MLNWGGSTDKLPKNLELKCLVAPMTKILLIRIHSKCAKRKKIHFKYFFRNFIRFIRLFIHYNLF